VSDHDANEQDRMTETPRGGTVLIAEDDENIAFLVQTYMEQAGFATIVAHDGRKALEAARACAPALIILDWMLPSLDGPEFCREIRKTSDVPILMLTARQDEIDRIVGFSLGIDDYVVKPFSPRELVERVKAILRRTGAGAGANAPEPTLRLGELSIEPGKRKVVIDGRTVSLTPTEYTLLSALVGQPGRVFSRADLLDRLYPGGEAVVDRVIDVHIGKLRHKIEPDPQHPAYILTVHGIGYKSAESIAD